MRFKLFESGPIPYTISWTFLFSLFYLYQILVKKVAPLSLANLNDSEVLRAVREHNDPALVQALSKQYAEGSFGYYGRRLYRLRERYGRDPDLAAVIALKNEILEIDEEDFALSFVAVIWCELALPLLGFLGTVVGIGGSIGEIQKGVQKLFQDSKLTDDVLKLFDGGFKNMAVAFDTTFLGLAGLIILGVFHTNIKKRLAAELAQARELFSNAVAQWIGEGASSVIVSLTNVVTSVQQTKDALETRMQAVEEATQASDRHANVFRETIRDMTERVIIEDPKFQSVKDVLFKPVVEFKEAGVQLAIKTRKRVNETLGTHSWRFTGLSLSTSVPGSGVVAVRKTQNYSDPDHLLFFDIDGADSDELKPATGQLTRLFTLHGEHALLAQTDSGALVLTHNGASNRMLIEQITPDEDVQHIRLDQDELTIIIRRDGQAVNIEWMEINPKAGPKYLYQLPNEFNWSIWSVNSPSATLLFAGKSLEGAQWQMRLVQIQQRAAKVEEAQQQEQEEQKQVQKMEIVADASGWLDLPSALVPKQLVPIASGEVLILDDGGNLHYWNTNRPAPLKLSHPEWNADPKSIIRAGTGGWIAVAAQNRLKMWRVRRGGVLYPYEHGHTGLEIGAADLDTLRVTSDGRYLLAIGAQQNIVTWEFPRYVIDEF